jgi:hypothetical protein
MLKLPTRVSSVFICHCDIKPDEDDACLSLPQDLYISTLTGWTDPKLEPAIMQPMRDYYRQAFPVAVGQYITDIDINCEDANVSSANTRSDHVLTCCFLLLIVQGYERYGPGQVPWYS